jgi:hypothetical protein
MGRFILQLSDIEAYCRVVRDHTPSSDEPSLLNNIWLQDKLVICSARFCGKVKVGSIWFRVYIGATAIFIYFV